MSDPFRLLLREYTCPICKKKFIVTYNLKSWVYKISGVPLCSWKCYLQCEKNKKEMFKQRLSHAKSKGALSPLVCDILKENPLLNSQEIYKKINATSERKYTEGSVKGILSKLKKAGVVESVGKTGKAYLWKMKGEEVCQQKWNTT